MGGRAGSALTDFEMAITVVATVVSVAADRASTSATAVGVAKAALRNLAQSLHKELEPDGVRVTTVTIDGVLQGPKALDLDEIADLYWRLHTQPAASVALSLRGRPAPPRRPLLAAAHPARPAPGRRGAPRLIRDG